MDKKILVVLLLSLLFAGTALAGDPSASTISYEPAPASPGSTVTVWVQVKNDSVYDAENVIVRLNIEYPLFLQAGEEKEIVLEVIKARKTITVEYKLQIDAKAIDGEYGMEVLVGEGIPSKKHTSVLNVLSKTPKLEIVASSINELTPGSVEPVLLTIQNVGGSIAKDIVLKVNPERTVTAAGLVVEREIISLGAVSNFIGSLEQSEEAQVALMLAVNQDAELKNYSVPVTLEYHDINGSAKTATSYLGIKVRAEAEVDAVINSVSPRAYPGGTSEIVIDMFNIGLAEARYVVVELSGNKVKVAEPRQFIGTLEADDFDSFKTEITFDPTTPVGKHTINLNIIYKDDQLEQKVITKTLIVTVASTGEAIDGGGIGASIGFIVGTVLQLLGLYMVARWTWPRVKAFRQRTKK